MQKTIQDFKKLSNKGQNLFKGFFYYAYVPVVVILGLRTVSWEQFSNPQMWLDRPSAIKSDNFVLFYFIIKLHIQLPLIGKDLFKINHELLVVKF